MNTYRKPAEGADCTRCGLCCVAIPCGIGLMLGSPVNEPCQLLEWEDGKSKCGALSRPGGEAFARRLGIGKGCDSGPDDGEPDIYEGMTAQEYLDGGRGMYEREAT